MARWGGDDPRPRTPMKERAYPTVQACKFGRSGDTYFRKLLPKNKWWVHRPGVTPPSVSESFYFLKPAVTQPSTWLDTHVRSPNPSRRLLRAGPRRGRTSTPGFYLVCKITLFCRREPLCQCAIISFWRWKMVKKNTKMESCRRTPYEYRIAVELQCGYYTSECV